jgi:O-antigen biosynthesis protein
MADIQLSVIIVSYNALHYLDLCLRSTLKATVDLNAEIIVVDNDSQEPVASWIEKNFKSVRLIKSKENLGFGKANNLGVEEAKGEVILFLNPDTIISKEAINSVLINFKANPNVGALGLRMIDGDGNFLQESKRSTPTLWSSFCRVSGLTSLFPNSQLFSSYRNGHIDEHSISNIEILSGACMFVNVKEIENRLFDPDFYMYGEDIDLSYRIMKSGYKVFYLGSETIIHFKGESTNKRNWSYHYWFFQTMWLFRKKHFNGFLQELANAILFPLIWFLMMLSYLKNMSSPINNEKVIHSNLYSIIGEKTERLLSLIGKQFGTSRITENTSESDLIIINVNNINASDSIELMNSKKEIQKILFWNEELGLLFGSPSKKSQGIRFLSKS